MDENITELWSKIRWLESDLASAKRDIAHLEVELDRKADELHEH